MLYQIKAQNPGTPNPVNVCTLTVKMDLCIGCGVCVPVCPTNTLEMQFNPNGLFEPIDHGDCRKGCHVCVDVCPFLDQTDNEDSIAARLFSAVPQIKHSRETGFYLRLHAGYVPALRATSTSGGLGRWLLAELLKQRLVDAVLCVRETRDPEKKFEYAIFQDPEEALQSPRSAYYPVEMSNVLQHVTQNDGRYAVVGVPCFIKGLQLANRKNRWLRERIRFTIGLACGQTKSKFFHEYLVRYLGITPDQVEHSGFRYKDEAKRPANDSIFRAQSADGQSREVNFLGNVYGFAYNSGQFKPNACNFCDDIFAEVADAVLMDAWLPRYIQNRKGTSILLTRKPELEQLVQHGIASGDVMLEPIGIEDTIESQMAIVDIKRTGLAYRLWLAEHDKRSAPTKRVPPLKPTLIEGKLQRAYQALSVESFDAMAKQQAAGPGLQVFDEAIASAATRYRRMLLFSRRVDAYWKAIKRRWTRLITTGSIGPMPFKEKFKRAKSGAA
jgi:coenzyme F420 hydrogenase subunit beta